MALFPQGAIICRSRYGSTKQYAQWLSERLHLPVYDPKLDIIPLNHIDYLLIGSPVYTGKMLIRKWLKAHAAELKDKTLFFFIVCGTSDEERELQQKIVRDNIPAEIAGGGSIFFLPGRLVIGKLSWIDRLLLRIGSSLVKDPAKKAGMRQGMDGVDQRHLEPLLSAAMKTKRVV